LEEAEFCNWDEDCGAELVCKSENIWPYWSKCRKYVDDGEVCERDHECLPVSFCWFKSAADVVSNVKKCMKKYDLETGETFGWATPPFDYPFF